MALFAAEKKGQSRRDVWARKPEGFSKTGEAEAETHVLFPSPRPRWISATTTPGLFLSSPQFTFCTICHSLLFLLHFHDLTLPPLCPRLPLSFAAVPPERHLETETVSRHPPPRALWHATFETTTTVRLYLRHHHELKSTLASLLASSPGSGSHPLSTRLARALPSWPTLPSLPVRIPPRIQRRIVLSLSLPARETS